MKFQRIELSVCTGSPREEGSPFLFIGGQPGRALFDMSLLALLKRMERLDFTPHGMRTSFRTWCSEATSYAPDICEMALAHQVGNEVERAYNRTTMFDKRRKLMDEWSRYCTSPPVATTDNVVAFRAQAAE